MKKDFFTFLISRKFLQNIAGIILLILVLFFVLNWWLKSYTLHGDHITVPDFSGTDYLQAQILAKEHSLKLVINDTIYSELVRPGQIADHTPKAGKKVKPNRTIYLSINATGPIMVKMPKAYDVSIRQARNILSQSGLQIGRIEYKPDIADGYVFEQHYKNSRIEPGTLIPRGSKISLVVGRGSDNTTIVVPSIIGETYTNALAILDSIGINYNPIFSQGNYESREDSVQSIVWRQSPLAGDNRLMNISQILDFWVQPKDILLPEIE